MIVTYFDHSLHVSINGDEYINIIHFTDYICNTLNSFILTYISSTPTDELTQYVNDFFFDMATLSIEDIQTFKMAIY